MAAINVKKMGLAVGLTLVILRVGCIIIFSSLSREQAVSYFNTLVHGIDVGPIIRMETIGIDTVYGLVQIFILGWLIGALTASIYNLPFCCKGKEKSGSCCH